MTVAAADVVAAAAPSVEAPVVVAAVVESTADADSNGAAEEVQICGGGWVRIDGDEEQVENNIDAMVEPRNAAVRDSTLAAMRSSSDERVQAAAAYYEASLARFRDVPAVQCTDTGDCTRAFEAYWQSAEPRRDALARLAESTVDPTVYAWAFSACARAKGAFGCQSIGAAQWTRLDPDNAVAWLALADEARTQGDTAGVDDAMYHVASATRLDGDEARLAATLLDHVPAGESALFGAASLAAMALGFSMSAAAEQGQTIASYCGPSGLADANRRESCDRIARLAVERGTSFTAWQLGFSIGRRVGWPAERLRALEAERVAMTSPASRPEPTVVTRASCETAQDHVRDIRDLAEFGQVEAMRRRALVSSRTARVVN